MTARHLGYAAPVGFRSITRLDGDTSESQRAALAAEVPVALVYNGRTHVVMMCTPSDLEDFAVGFTLTESIATPKEVSRVNLVRYSGGIELQVELPADVAARLADRGRALVGRTGCGLCGVEAVSDALRTPPLVQSSAVFSRAALWRAGEALGAHQPLNADTNAIHAAGFAGSDGDLRIVREDVGRHNALDKVIGAMASGGISGTEGFFVVTSRASYELVQKTAAANVPLLAAVSRPTALAVDLAETAGIGLVGLLRGHTANAYAHAERVR
jgi:FdhD protein